MVAPQPVAIRFDHLGIGKRLREHIELVTGPSRLCLAQQRGSDLAALLLVFLLEMIEIEGC